MERRFFRCSRGRSRRDRTFLKEAADSIRRGHYPDHRRDGLGPARRDAGSDRGGRRTADSRISDACARRGPGRLRARWLSRGAAGIRGDTIIINLPGSPTGAVESLDTIADLCRTPWRCCTGRGTISPRGRREHERSFTRLAEIGGSAARQFALATELPFLLVGRCCGRRVSRLSSGPLVAHEALLDAGDGRGWICGRASRFAQTAFKE